MRTEAEAPASSCQQLPASSTPWSRTHTVVFSLSVCSVQRPLCFSEREKNNYKPEIDQSIKASLYCSRMSSLKKNARERELIYTSEGFFLFNTL